MASSQRKVWVGSLGLSLAVHLGLVAGWPHWSSGTAAHKRPTSERTALWVELLRTESVQSARAEPPTKPTETTVKPRPKDDALALAHEPAVLETAPIAPSTIDPTVARAVSKPKADTPSTTRSTPMHSGASNREGTPPRRADDRIASHRSEKTASRPAKPSVKNSAPPPTPVIATAPSDVRERASSAVADPHLERLYLSELSRLINAQLRYPRRARRRGVEGTVMLSFVVDPQGNVLESTIRDGSDLSLLHRAALDALARAAPLPAPPTPMARSRLRLTLPVRFVLRGGA